MDNRFTFKDLIQLLLLASIVVILVLMMIQNDRQWTRFSQLSVKLDEQTRDLSSLRRMIGEGGFDRGAQAPLAATPEGEQQDIFRRVREVEKQPDYATGDWFIEAFSSAPPKLNYLTAQDVYARVVYCRVVEPLAEFDIETLKLTPYLARDWEMAEDGLSMTVHLRRDVIFSDGEPMDADDVVYTWQLNQNPDIVDGRQIEYLRHISKVEKIDDYTVKFHFTKVFYENELRALEEPVLPRHFFEKYTAREIRDNPAMLLGTGPYRLPDPTRYVPGERIELLRNERYWGPPPPWNRIIWRLIEKESAELVSFRNREIDLFAPTPEQHLDMLKDQPLLDRTQHFAYEHIRTGYTYIAWNQKLKGKPTIFADKRVRQAMTMMLDRQRMVDEVFLGFANVATGPFSPLSDQDNPDVRPWPYDPGRAVELLKEVGFTVGDDGSLYRPDGKPFEVTITYPAGSDFYQKIMLMVKDNFAKAGVVVNLNPQEWSLLLQTLTSKDFEAIILGWGAGGLESDIEQMFHSRTIAGSGDNRNAYSNPQLDELIDQAHVTLNYEKRMEIWQKCHEILHEDQPYTFMFRPQVRLWLDDRIENVQRIPVIGLNYVQTWPIPLEWYVPAERQLRGNSKSETRNSK